MYIYCTTNIVNGKKYVGLCTKNINESLNYYGSGTLFIKSFKKYEKHNFIKEILEDNLSYSNIHEREIYWISKINSKHPIGYNLCDGGRGSLNPSDITRRKLSESHLGKKLTEEQKRKIGEKSKNRKHTEESKNKLSVFHTGKKLSDETKLKISNSSKNKKSSILTRKKISDSLIGNKRRLGIPQSDETKIKISKAGIGRKHNELTRQKISDKQSKKMVCQIDILTNKVINIFPSIKEASVKVNCSRPNLSRCLNKKRQTVASFKWEFYNNQNIY